MEITYLGHSSFKLKNKEGLVLIIDPFNPEFVGLPYPKDVADVLIMSHSHADHNFKEVITGPVKRNETFVIENEGEYEIGGVEISCIKTYHDKVEGAERGKNLITVIRMDDLTVCHLGDLGSKLNETQIEKLGSVDVLMVPVGGEFTLSMDMVFDTINDIQPSLVIPMHYKVDSMGEEFQKLSTLQNFLDKNKYPLNGEASHKVKVDESSLPDDTQVVLMNG
jgi:L-ascorbate metabolism protein UlaG (beta-lactamase superfamily)